MEVICTKIEGLIVFEPRVYADGRGYFIETWSKQRYQDAGIKEDFVQDNISSSCRGTLRGLHYQNPNGQGKLVQVLKGAVLDAVVDIRVGSKTFGEWESFELSEENCRQVYVPPGFAHGFCVLSDRAIFSYKCTDFYNPQAEGGVLWNDPDIGIEWPVDEPVISEKDMQHKRLCEIPAEKLPSI